MVHGLLMTIVVLGQPLCWSTAEVAAGWIGMKRVMWNASEKILPSQLLTRAVMVKVACQQSQPNDAGIYSILAAHRHYIQYDIVKL